MSKGGDTKRTIVDHALGLVSRTGLGALSIGALALETGMSKSGLFAHFGSKEALQLTVLQAARERFVDVVVAPALKRPRGEPRVREMMERVLTQWEKDLPGGCIFYAVTAELDDQAGPTRDYLIQTQVDYRETVLRAAAIAVEEGHFRNDLDLEQFVFEYGSITTGFHYTGRLLRIADAEARARRQFEALLERSRSPDTAERGGKSRR